MKFGCRSKKCALMCYPWQDITVQEVSTQGKESRMEGISLDFKKCGQGNNGKVRGDQVNNCMTVIFQYQKDKNTVSE